MCYESLPDKRSWLIGAVTFVNTSSDFFVWLPSTSCIIFFWFLILCRVMIYFSSITTNRWFVEIKLWFTWLSCFFSGLSAPSPCLFSLLWVCFLLCIYLLFSFFFSVSYVIVNLFPIPNVYNQWVSDILLFLYDETSIVNSISFLSICSLVFVISIYHLSDMGLFPFNL